MPPTILDRPAAHTFTVYRKGQPITFQSPYDHDEAFERLAQVPGSFAADLVAKGGYNGISLSAAQWAWVHKLVVDHERPAPAGVDADLSGVAGLFASARQHLKLPRITLRVDGQTLKLGVCGPQSRHAGKIRVTDDGAYPDNRYFGEIDPQTGVLRPGRDLTDGVRQTLRRLSTDPAGFASEYGRLSGRCCFCDRHLEDERSTAQGYGPVCAERYGLPWGH
jgi:hypothetical protein